MLHHKLIKAMAMHTGCFRTDINKSLADSRNCGLWSSGRLLGSYFV